MSEAQILPYLEEEAFNKSLKDSLFLFTLNYLGFKTVSFGHIYHPAVSLT